MIRQSDRSDAADSPATSIVGFITRGYGLIASLLIMGATLAAYSNSLNGPFIFDDILAIAENPTIRNLRSFDIFNAPLNANGATGRPLVNLSLAINYAFSGVEVHGYHLFNLGLHTASALLLFGLVRRTLLSIPLRARWSLTALSVAAAVALLWAVHPLQTEAVTGVIQRTELLGGFFLLLTLYCFIRAAETQAAHRMAASRLWATGTIAACALGMAAKEFMAVAPVLALLYDRTFFAGTFSAAWRQRRGLYLGLGASWLVIVVLLIQTPQRNHNVGFGLGVSSWDYLLTQCHAILLYLKLAVWPHPLVLDYGTGVISRLTEVWWQASLLVLLLLGTIWALVRRPPLGFLGAWFFIILAPSSSFVPLITQTMAEHRMYLPLVPAIIIGVLAAQRLLGPRFIFAAAALAVAFGTLTFRRNTDYRSATVIWQDTAAKFPGNARVHYALGTALLAEGRSAEAIPSFEQALRLQPDLPGAYNNLGTAFANIGQANKAIDCYERALQVDPSDSGAHNNLGTMLHAAGRLPEAIRHYRQALQIKPGYVEARYNLGLSLANLGQTADAIVEFREVLQRDAELVPAWCSLGYALRRAGQKTEAIASFAEALRRDPNSVAAREGLARLRAEVP